MSSFKTHLKNYGETTSVKGVSKVIKSKHYILKVIWLLACLAGASLAIYQLVWLTRNYLDYDTTTQINQCTDCSPVFPDVTICNLNPVALVSSFPGLLQFKEYLEIVDNVTDLNDTHFLELYQEDILRNTSQDEFLEVLYRTYYSLAGYFHNMNESDLLLKVGDKDIAASLVSFCEWYDWQDSTYTKEDCMEQSMYFFSTPDYSVCTTIHINDTNTISNNTDVKGFGAVLFLNDFNRAFMVGYDHNILKSQARGARVLIHPPNSLPEMRKGFNIPPGHEVSIHLETRETIRQPAPYSDCSEQEFLEEGSDVSSGLGGSQIVQFIYNDHDAASLCQQEELVKKCGCFHPSLPVTQYLKSKYQVPGCIKLMYKNVSKSLFEVAPNDFDLDRCAEQVSCYGMVTSATKEQQGVLKNCTFRQPCRQTTYSHRVYQSPWPHESYQLAFYCRHINNNDTSCEKYGGYSDDPGLAEYFTEYSSILDQLHDDGVNITYEKLQEEDLIARNFIQLKVYFLEKNVEVYKEVPKVTLAYLTGSVGGILNLWIGVTFFTVIELVDFVYTLLVDLWERRAKKRESQSTTVYPMDK